MSRLRNKRRNAELERQKKMREALLEKEAEGALLKKSKKAEKVEKKAEKVEKKAEKVEKKAEEE